MTPEYYPLSDFLSLGGEEASEGEGRFDCQQILELMDRDASLEQILDLLARAIEEGGEGLLCSILLLDSSNNLKTAAAPSLPRNYLEGIDRVAIGWNIDPYGIDSWHQKVAVAVDITSDTAWEDYRALVLGHGLRAWWSVPINSARGGVRGAIDVYCRESRGPSGDELRLIYMACLLASHAIERQQLVEKNQASDQLFRRAFDNAPIGMALLDLEGSFLQVNHSLCQTVGYSPEELVGTSFQQITANEDLENNLDYLRQLVTGKIDSFQIEKRYRHKTGQMVWVLINASLVRDNSGNPLYFISQVQDISERKTTEESLKYYRNHLQEQVNERTGELIKVNAQLLQEKNARNRAQEQVKVGEAMYKELFNNISSGVAVYEVRGSGMEFVFKDYNRAAEQIDEIEKENVLGKSVQEVFPAIREFGLLEVFQRVWQTGQPEELREAFYQDARIRGWRHNYVYKLPSGELVSVFDDISSRKQSEQAIKESEKKLRKLFQHANDAIFLLEITERGEVGRFLEVNDLACKILGHTRNELYQLTPKDLGFGDYAIDPKWLALEPQESNQQQNATLHTISFNDKGLSIVLELNGHIFDLSGKPVLLAIGRDISERLETDKALREGEERYRMLFELSPNAVFVHLEGRIVFANLAAAKLLEVSTVEELAGKPMLDFVDPRSREAARQQVNEIIATNQVTPFNEIQILLPDGTTKEIEASGGPFTFEGKAAVQVVCRDITERRKIDKEYQKIEKLESLGILAGGIAHDFNNILTVVMGNASLAKLKLNGQETIKAKLTEIEKAVQQAKYLTQQLLTFSKGGEPVKETSTVEELVWDTTSLALSGSNVRARFHFPENLWAVEIDKGQIGQVMHNLVINAVQAMPGGGILTVQAENIAVGPTDALLKDGNYVKISIVDQGVGIPPNYLEKIFDPYFTTKQKGSGLGLTTTYAIIRKHSGRITVESDPGKGTTFHIFLPASLQKPVSNKEKEMITTGSGRILLMDDEEHIRAIAFEMLGLLGYEVSTVAEGALAVAKFREEMLKRKAFDLVITDLTVPGGMGVKEVLKRLRELDSQVKVIVSSGYSNDPVMSDFSSYGFDGCVIKPYEMDTLAKEVARVMALTKGD